MSAILFGLRPLILVNASIAALAFGSLRLVILGWAESLLGLGELISDTVGF